MTIPLWLAQWGHNLNMQSDPEKARKNGIWALKNGLHPRISPYPSSDSSTLEGKPLFGKAMPNCIGLPAGAVKDADPDVLQAMFLMGFGFVEAGSVAPSPRVGNTTNGNPVLWRLGQGLVNYYGLNSNGLEAFKANLVSFRARYGDEPVLGASLVNPDNQVDEHARDKSPAFMFTIMAERLSYNVDYFTINFSCPNSHEEKARSEETMVAQIKATVLGANGKAVLLKIAPMGPEDLQRTVKAALEAGIDGFVVCNTFNAAAAQQFKLFGELTAEVLESHWPRLLNTGTGKLEHVGGYSGPETFEHIADMIDNLSQLLPLEMPIIASGGINSHINVNILRWGGATAVQLYTGLVNHGPKLMQDILHG